MREEKKGWNESGGASIFITSLLGKKIISNWGEGALFRVENADKMIFVLSFLFLSLIGNLRVLNDAYSRSDC